MGFVNVADGVRAIGYLERDPLPAGPVALVTHSGSAFSALLRSHRRHRLHPRRLVRPGAGDDDRGLPRLRPRRPGDPGRRAAARDGARTRSGCARRWPGPPARTCRSCVLTVGGSPVGTRPGQRALGRARRQRRGLGGAGRRARPAARRGPRRDGRHARAARRGTPGRQRRSRTRDGPRLRRRAGAGRRHRARGAASPSRRSATTRRHGSASLLEPGLVADQPARRLGHGRRHPRAVRRLPDARWPTTQRWARWRCASTSSRSTTATSPIPLAVLDVAAATDKPVVVLSNMASALDQRAAARLRAAGVPVLEGTRSGLRALGHLFSTRGSSAGRRAPAGRDRRRTQSSALEGRCSPGRSAPSTAFALLRDYGIPTVNVDTASLRRGGRACGRAASAGRWCSRPTPRRRAQVRRRRRAYSACADEASLARRTTTWLGGSARACSSVQHGAGRRRSWRSALVTDPLLGPLGRRRRGRRARRGAAATAASGCRRSTRRARRGCSTDWPARPLLDGHRGGPAADLDVGGGRA